jgi:hypothetical protein
MKNFFLGVVSLAAILAIAGGAYIIGTRQNVKPSSETVVLPPAQNGVPLASSPTPPTEEADAEEVIQQIVAAMESKNYAALEGYMASSVFVRLEATECCGGSTPTEAISQLSYVDEALNWDFDTTNPVIIALYELDHSSYSQNHIIGIADTEHLIAFGLDSENKIYDISMAVTYKLLIPTP